MPSLCKIGSFLCNKSLSEEVISQQTDKVVTKVRFCVGGWQYGSMVVDQQPPHHSAVSLIPPVFNIEEPRPYQDRPRQTHFYLIIRKYLLSEGFY